MELIYFLIRLLILTKFYNNNNDNNNNNIACIAPVYQRLQRRWTDYGRENWLGLNVWRNKNVLRVDFNTASEVPETKELSTVIKTTNYCSWVG